MTRCSADGPRTPARSVSRYDDVARLVRARPRSSLVLAIGVCTMVLTTLTGGCSSGDPSQQTPDRKVEQPSVQAQRLAGATAAAASVLADVEACESAVNAGASLDELSEKTSHARDSVNAFARSADGRLLPRVTAAIALAAREYYKSCAVWRADENVAQTSWKNRRIGGIDDYRHPSRYQDMWVQAAIDLGVARSTLQDATP